jgi:NAD+ diphosphatase
LLEWLIDVNDNKTVDNNRKLWNNSSRPESGSFMRAPDFLRVYPPSVPVPGPKLWLLMRDGALLVQEGDQIQPLEGEDDPRGKRVLSSPLYLGLLDGKPCLADDLAANDTEPGGTRLVSLRSAYGVFDDALFSLAGYAVQMLHWRRTSGYCPVCGHMTEARAGDWGRKCPHCGHVSYPHVSPAVLILVHDGANRILLGHKPGWGARYSILAGFVEPGEQLEECVVREAKEEAGIDVADLVYRGSQPWPYPHQLMVGFSARFVGGELRADAEELDDAQWFTAETMPELPSAVSLSRQMIDAWIADQQK